MGEESRRNAAAAVQAKRHTAGTRAREGERRCIDKQKCGLEAMIYSTLFFGRVTQRSLQMRTVSKQKLERVQGPDITCGSGYTHPHL